ncbi:MAG: hypothetical protein RL318_2508, partial [Fibrobacterota bacterium]
MSFLSLILALSSTVPTALPFDSIANPLLKSPAGTDIQLTGDLANLTPGAVRVNQAGYRLIDVRQGRARFHVIAPTGATSATLTG